MRVILSYRNQNLTETSSSSNATTAAAASAAVLEQTDDDYFEQQEENLPSPTHNNIIISENNNILVEKEGNYNTTANKNCTKEYPTPLGESKQASSSSVNRLAVRNDLEERKLPALRKDTSLRKKRKQIEASAVTPSKKPCPTTTTTSYNLDEPQKKLPAKKKMTAGRYPDEVREPPPEDDYNLEEEEGNLNVSLTHDDEEQPVLVVGGRQKDVMQVQDEFRKALKSGGLEIREQEGDGNCLFRAVSYQVYGDANMHMDVRQQCLDHMSKDEEHFSHFVEGEEFGAYIKRKRKEGVHGNNPEIQAISELFNRPVEVFTPENGAKPINIFQSEYKTSDVPIRLSYQDNHYDAVIDPLLPTAGLGLGLPGLQPGLADKMQLAKAVRESDQLADQVELKKAIKESHDDELQRAIKESSLSVDHMYSKKVMALSDLEATNFDLEQAVLESSLDEFRRSEAGRKQKATDQVVSSQIVGDSASIANNSSVPLSSSSAVLPASSAAALPFASASAAVASVPSAASIANNNTTSSSTTTTSNSITSDEYPSTVQELVMNGFELSKVIHAYELIGDNFDDLLAFLVSTNSS